MRIQGELLRTIAGVFAPGNIVSDPLAQVAAQVQNQVANGVLRLAATPPDLVFVKAVEATLDVPRHLLQLGHRMGNEQVRNHAFSSAIVAPPPPSICVAG